MDKKYLENQGQWSPSSIPVERILGCMFAANSALQAQGSDDPDSKIHGANMGPIWGRQDPGGPHVGPMNFAIWGVIARTSQIS